MAPNTDDNYGDNDENNNTSMTDDDNLHSSSIVIVIATQFVVPDTININSSIFISQFST